MYLDRRAGTSANVTEEVPPKHSARHYTHAFLYQVGFLCPKMMLRVTFAMCVHFLHNHKQMSRFMCGKRRIVQVLITGSSPHAAQ